MITKTGTITVREDGVVLEHFSFENEESLRTATIQALEWAIARLRRAIEEENAPSDDTLPGGSFVIPGRTA